MSATESASSSWVDNANADGGDAGAAEHSPQHRPLCRAVLQSTLQPLRSASRPAFATESNDHERWFVAVLSARVGPLDHNGELHSPPTGVLVTCWHPVEPRDPIWDVFRQQLELHHPGQRCRDCQHSWHHCSQIDSGEGIAIDAFSVLLPLGEAQPLDMRLRDTDLPTLFDAAATQVFASLRRDLATNYSA